MLVEIKRLAVNWTKMIVLCEKVSPCFRSTMKVKFQVVYIVGKFQNISIE